jgi:pimeloyl-ACP methyl ester carboxylesterase
MAGGNQPEPFRVATADAALDDLYRRLAATRLPLAPADGGLPARSRSGFASAEAGWRYGADLAYMRDLVEYWRDGYDWRRWESALNRWQQFRSAPLSSPYGDIRLHYLVKPGAGANPLPLLLLHGWPGSVFEFYKAVDPLAQPERHGGAAGDGFTVICPSLPGYGFSTGLERPMPPRAMAALLRRFMVDHLGIARFAVQAGDWGSVIATWMGVDHPESLIALHLNMFGLSAAAGPGTPPLSAAEADWLKAARRRLSEEGAYQKVQGTKPQSLAFGLNDSPVGLAAWIVEKFHGWSVADASQPPPFSRDELLTNVMIYWLTGAIASANWLYWAHRHSGETALPPGRRVATPTAFAFFANEIFPAPPNAWIERAYTMVRRSDFPVGGHFAALERPQELIADVREFFRDYRS